MLRTARGKLVGQFESIQLVDFLRRAPTWLITLTKHVRLLKEVAYRNRVEIRRLARVRRTLEAARNAGLSTPNGRGYVESAIRALYEDPDDR